MILPRILIIDDQYARDDDERSILKRNAGILEITPDTSDAKLTQLTEDNLKKDIVAAAVFCSGQKIIETEIENRYDLIKEAVARGWGSGSKYKWNLILLDVQFDSGLIKNGMPIGHVADAKFGETVRDRLNHDFRDLPLVMISNKNEKEIESGKTHYLSKEGLVKWELRKCLLTHGKELSTAQLRCLLNLDEQIIADSELTVSVFREAFIHAKSNASVLLLGESGVGKEVLARYIHKCSDRKDKTFVAVNVAAIPKDLLESDFFGHEKGAFTGAHAKKIGKFELADEGTLFLDEIGEMPIDLQTKVLRVIQEREFERVGGTKVISTNVRLVAATNKDLESEAEKGNFREDLYYRLNVVSLYIPPLRERVEDIIPLAEVFLKKFLLEYGKTGITFSPDAKNILKKHLFPGNVRELENLVHKLVSMTGLNRVIHVKNVASALKKPLSTPPKPPVPLPKPDQETRTQTIKAPEPPKTSFKPPSAVPVAPSAEVKETQGTERPITLQNLVDILNTLPIDKDDPALKGAKPRLEEALQNLMKHLLGAALAGCKGRSTGPYTLKDAVVLIEDDPSITTSDPKRIVNKILGRIGKEDITESDLEEVVAQWKASLK